MLTYKLPLITHHFIKPVHGAALFGPGWPIFHTKIPGVTYISWFSLPFSKINSSRPDHYEIFSELVSYESSQMSTDLFSSWYVPSIGNFEP